MSIWLEQGTIKYGRSQAKINDEQEFKMNLSDDGKEVVVQPTDEPKPYTFCSPIFEQKKRP